MTSADYEKLVAAMLERLRWHEQCICTYHYYEAKTDILHTVTPETVWIDL